MFFKKTCILLTKVLYYKRGGKTITEWYYIDDFVSETGLPICILARIQVCGGIDVASFHEARYLSGKYVVYKNAVPTFDNTKRVRDMGCLLKESEVLYAKRKKQNRSMYSAQRLPCRC